MDEVALSSERALLVLNGLPQIGPITTRRLLEAFAGDAPSLFRASPEALKAVKGVGPVIAAAIADWRTVFDLEREEERIAKAGVRFLPSTELEYPSLLREIHDPPIGLYRKGMHVLDRPCVAIVGSRRTTHYGQTIARRLGTELARAGYCVVSGLARGIDTAAHEGALACGGRTVGVLGHGIDLVYPPENLALFRALSEQGAILSEFPFSRPPDRQTFAMRNRIVAGMSVALVVVESDVDGGSMITAKFAGDQGRQVFAVPGRIDQPSSAGCHQLIRDGATLLTCVDDILSELGYLNGLQPGPILDNPARHPHPVRASEPLSEKEARVFSTLQGGALLPLDVIARESGLPIAVVASTVMQLELKRRIIKRSDGRYELRLDG